MSQQNSFYNPYTLISLLTRRFASSICKALGRDVLELQDLHFEPAVLERTSEKRTEIIRTQLRRAKALMHLRVGDRGDPLVHDLVPMHDALRDRELDRPIELLEIGSLHRSEQLAAALDALRFRVPDLPLRLAGVEVDLDPSTDLGFAAHVLTTSNEDLALVEVYLYQAISNDGLSEVPGLVLDARVRNTSLVKDKTVRRVFAVELDAVEAQCRKLILKEGLDTRLEGPPTPVGGNQQGRFVLGVYLDEDRFAVYRKVEQLLIRATSTPIGAQSVGNPGFGSLHVLEHQISPVPNHFL